MAYPRKDRFFVDIHLRIRVIGSSPADFHNLRIGAANIRVVSNCPYKKVLIELFGTFLPIFANYLLKLTISTVYAISVVLCFQHYADCTLE